MGKYDGLLGKPWENLGKPWENMTVYNGSMNYPKPMPMFIENMVYRWLSQTNENLIGGLEHVFFQILGISIPTDFHIFSEGLKPPTIYICIAITGILLLCNSKLQYIYIYIHTG